MDFRSFLAPIRKVGGACASQGGVKKLVAQRHWREAAFKTHKLAEPRVIGTPQDEGNMSV